MALGGSITEVFEPNRILSYRGAWKDGAFEHEIEVVRVSDSVRTGLFLKGFRIAMATLRMEPATPAMSSQADVGSS
ncbi:MAG: hypothetical protein IT435_01995 [Phycisphaerales bacterium]|nr:hypothetical protein [Phycisphaerales bacterium]